MFLDVGFSLERGLVGDKNRVLRIEEVAYWRKCQYFWKMCAEFFTGTMPWLEEIIASTETVVLSEEKFLRRTMAITELLYRQGADLWNVATFGRVVMRKGEAFGKDALAMFFEKSGSLLQILIPELFNEVEKQLIINFAYHITGGVVFEVVEIKAEVNSEVSRKGIVKENKASFRVVNRQEMIYRPEFDDELEDIVRRIGKALSGNWIFENVGGVKRCAECVLKNSCDWDWRKSELWR